MYQPTRSPESQAQLTDPAVRSLRWTSVSRTVWFLGFTSLFADASAEMITSTLPLYVIFGLQLSPASFGIIDGLQQGGAALLRMVGGVLTDRWRRPKIVAVSGYAMSALCRPALLLVGRSAGGLTALTFLDRLGKGLRTSPRDAMISMNSQREGLGAAFGVHRTLDTLGAILGPVVAFVVLQRIRGGYDVVFVVSFVLAVIGLAVLAIFVRAEATAIGIERTPQIGESATRLLREPRVRAIGLSIGALSASTLSDGFIYLLLQRRLNFNPGYLPLLYVATPVVYMVLAAPAGWLADRVGRGTVVVAGYAGLLTVYGVLLMPASGLATLVICVGLMGVYYAATDGVVPALTSAVVPPALRGTGLAVVGSASDVGKIVSGVLFGWLWSRFGGELAVGVFMAALAVTLATAGPALRRIQADVESR